VEALQSADWTRMKSTSHRRCLPEALDRPPVKVLSNRSSSAISFTFMSPPMQYCGKVILDRHAEPAARTPPPKESPPPQRTGGVASDAPRRSVGSGAHLGQSEIARPCVTMATAAASCGFTFTASTTTLAHRYPGRPHSRRSAESLSTGHFAARFSVWPQITSLIRSTTIAHLHRNGRFIRL
jgi:hypothetical protein